MKKFIKALLTTVFSLIAIGVFFWSSGDFDMLHVDRLSLALSTGESWAALSNFTHNAYFPWLFPTFLTQQPLPSLFVHRIILAVYLLVAFSGLCIACFLVSGEAIFRSILYSLLWCLACFSCFGLDTTVLASVAVFPWLIALFQIKLSKLAAIFFGLLLGIIGFSISNYLTIPLALLAWWYTSKQTSGTQNSAPIAAPSLILVASILCIFVQLPDWPNYPWNARLVEEDGLPGHLFPPFFPAWPIPTTDWMHVRELCFLPSLLMLGLSIFFWGSTKLTRTSASHTVLVGLSLLLVLDCLPVEAISANMPLSSLMRLLPYGSFVPIEPIVIASWMFLVCLQSVRQKVRLHSPWIAPAMLLLFLTATSSFGSLQMPFLQRSPHQMQHFMTMNFEEDRSLSEKIISPSLFVLANEGEWILDTWHINQTNFTALTELEVSVRASQNFEDAPISSLFDGRSRTRWIGKHGGQSGTEWLLFDFGKEVLLHAVRLNPGRFSTDFPAGLDFWIMNNCQNLDPIQEIIGTVPPDYQKRPWEGSIRTTPNGFPYYGELHKVDIHFPQSLLGQCLLVRQSGMKNLDWSVTKVAFLGEGLPLQQDDQEDQQVDVD